ncbi:protein disulfide-isomerase precursor [Basidiobolus ranarum]|uniref:protein disulfide-isomerase n=1 Tax=Basidiobolus ranarum TaxID=34480 RepID=A0ABR2WLC8_9FUNG
MLRYRTLVLTFFSFASSQTISPLTPSNFDQTVDISPLTLIRFHAPWSKRSKETESTFHSVALELKDQIKFATLDCSEASDLCSKYEIWELPALKIFRNGTKYDYSGPSESQGMMEYLKRQALPTLTQVNAENFNEFKDHDEIVIVGFLDNNEKEHQILREIALKFRDQFQTGISTDITLMDKLQITPPALMLYHREIDTSFKYEGAISATEVTQFIKSSSVPLISDMTPESYEIIREVDLPIAFIFYTSSQERAYLKKRLHKVAKELRGSISFGLIDGVEYEVFAELLNVDPKMPAVVIQTPFNNAKYVLPQDIPINSESVSTFAHQFLKGEVEPSLLSDEIPTKNEGLVKVVVGKEFNRIVMDTTKDVVVEFYESWCDTDCNEIDPLYEVVARKFSKQENLLFTKMNMKNNELPIEHALEVIGFPSVKLFKAGKTKEVIEFEGSQEVNAFIDFLKKYSTSPIEIEKISDLEEYQLILQMQKEHDKYGRPLLPIHDEL